MPLGDTTLITRCPDCHTAFRATPEQLAARDGHVRCGHCGIVFDARAHLLDPETLQPLRPATPSTSPLTAGRDAVQESRTTEESPAGVASTQPAPIDSPAVNEPGKISDPRAVVEGSNFSTAEPLPADAAERQPEPAPQASVHGPAPSPSDHGITQHPPDEADEKRVDIVAPIEAATPIEGAPSSTGHGALVSPDDAYEAAPPVDAFTGRNTTGDTLSTSDAADSTSVSPMAIAAKAATPAGLPHATTEVLFDAPPRPVATNRLSPWVSWPALVVLLLVLAGQVTFRYRGDLVLLFPGLKPWAEMACSPFNCEIPLPQRAELMSIESSDLQADSTNPGVMVLSATLRNRAPFAQMPPALELTLTDTQDQPVARRVLTAADYFARSGPALAAGNALFPPGAELPVKVFFETSALKATGYRLYLFYP